MDANGIIGLIGMVALAVWSWSDRPAGQRYYWAIVCWPIGGLWVINHVTRMRRNRAAAEERLMRDRELAWWAARTTDPDAPAWEQSLAQEIVDMIKESK